MTNEEHNKYLSWVFIGHGVFQTMLALLMIAFMSLFIFLPSDPRGNPPPPGFFIFIGAFMFLFQAALTAPSFIAAYGLRKKKSWARMASIIAGAIAAMNVPIGTAACVYAMWFFLGENWKEVYPEAGVEKDTKTETLQLQHERETRWTGYQTDEKGEVTFTPVEPPDWR